MDIFWTSFLTLIEPVAPSLEQHEAPGSQIVSFWEGPDSGPGFGLSLGLSQTCPGGFSLQSQLGFPHFQQAAKEVQIGYQKGPF